jgi:predicted benzoate:H+ symporter BenE
MLVFLLQDMANFTKTKARSNNTSLLVVAGLAASSSAETVTRKPQMTTWSSDGQPEG